MLGQGPPTESGIVIISGSNDFIPGLSDFQVVIGASLTDTALSPADPSFVMSSDPVSIFSPADAQGGLFLTDILQPELIPTIEFVMSSDPVSIFSPADAQGGLLLGDVLESNIIDLGNSGGFIPDQDLDINITSTSITTSGIVIIDIFPGAGEALIPFIPPIFINQRIFPVTFSGLGERLFPEENTRIYPVLPQFSVITPGD